MWSHKLTGASALLVGTLTPASRAAVPWSPLQNVGNGDERRHKKRDLRAHALFLQKHVDISKTDI